MAKSDNPFGWFDSSPEVIRTVVMMYVRFPLSLRQVEDLLAEAGCGRAVPRHETVHAHASKGQGGSKANLISDCHGGLASLATP